MECSWLWMVFALVVAVVVAEAKNAEVELKHGGRLQGTVMRTLKGKKVLAFRGIPYAEPPTGDLRFKAPVPKKPWTNVVDATQDGAMCTQLDYFNLQKFAGDEDCLFVNVFTPELPDKNDKDDDDLAVMVWIHGGGFLFGSGQSKMFGPEKLLDGKIVLVTVNYRLGPLGFLSTGDSASPGNYGLLDQNLALRWVQENIHVFNGDPTRVTIFGLSAGGASVGYQLLSPLSKGLFHRAIAQSGSPLCPWAFQEDPKYWSRKLAADVGCNNASSADMVECLRHIPASVFPDKTRFKVGILPMVFVPTVDGKFLLDEPHDILESGQIPNKVPFISGITQEEGIFMYAGVYRDLPTESTSKELIRMTIDLVLNDKEDDEPATDLVMEEYFADVDWQDHVQVRQAFIEFFSDSLFDTCHYETSHFLARANFELYTYSFDYAATSDFASLFGVKDHLGVGHADDMFTLFDFSKLPGVKKPTENDLKMSRIMAKLWTNFAKNGDPTPEVSKLLPLDWPPVTSATKFPVYHISLPVTTSTYELKRDRVYDFWTNKVKRDHPADGDEKHEEKEEL